MKKLQPVRGMHDILEFDTRLKKYFVRAFERITHLRGFNEIETPIIEDSEVFKKTLGLTSDIIKKETYTFKDRSNNELTLRPEGTAPIVRCFINNFLNESLPQKFTYSGAMFRYDRPQRGRLRQFYQLGAEIIGEKNISADLELISIATYFVNSLGIANNQFEIQVNSLGNEKDRQKYVLELKNFFQDHKKELTIESLERLKKNPLRILDTKNEKEKKLINKAPKLKNFLSKESSDIYEEFKKHCKELKIPIVVNDNLVRGLDYYNNICYEFVSLDKSELSQNSFLAGGRYDGLMKKMGGPDYPGCGFAVGLERIMLEKFNLNVIPRTRHVSVPRKYEYIVIVVGKQNKIKVLKIVNEIMWHQTHSVHLFHDKPMKMDIICRDNISKGLEYANKHLGEDIGLAKDGGDRYIIIIGDNEITKRQLTIKNLKNQTQKTIKIEEFVKYHLSK